MTCSSRTSRRVARLKDSEDDDITKDLPNPPPAPKIEEVPMATVTGDNSREGITVACTNFYLAWAEH